MAGWGYFSRVGLFLASVTGLVGFLRPLLLPIFLSNLALNSFIVAIFGGAVVFCLIHMVRVHRAMTFLQQMSETPYVFQESVRRGVLPSPSFLSPLVNACDVSARLSREAADAVYARYQALCDTCHATAKYLMGGLVFLGLLGTFFGLSVTIQGIADVISQMPTQDSSGGEVFFEVLKKSLQKPLDGMGTAFGASLFGLSASLIVGFVELQMAGLSTKFLNLLDAFCNTLTPQEPQFIPSDDSPSKISPAYVMALCGHIADHLERLQQTLQTAERDRSHFHASLQKTLGTLEPFVSALHEERPLMRHLQESTLSAQDHLQQISHALDILSKTSGIMVNLPTEMSHAIEKISAIHLNAQRESTEILQQELRLLTRTLAEGMEQPQTFLGA